MIDLTNWSLTIPVGNPAQIIKQPALNSYELDPWFVREGENLRFRANCGGGTTSGSSYPRCELREMKNGGRDPAKWSVKSGVHKMSLELSIDVVPLVKPEVVFSQVHGGSDDITVLKYDGKAGGIRYKVGDTTKSGILMPYTLGQRLKVDAIAKGGYIYWYLNGVQKAKVASSSTTAYWKCPTYVQSNVERGDKPDAFGQCTLYSLEVSHA